MTIKPILPLAGLLLAILLTACTPPAMRDEAAYDNIQQNMAKASRQRAAHSEAINEALLPPLVLDIPLAGKAAEPRFDLAVNAAPAGQVFLAIVSGTRYSMLLPSELAGTVTLNLKNVTVREALESIRDIYGYEFSVQGTRISIQANTIQTRLFQVSYLATKRGGGSATRVSGGMANTSGAGATAGASSGGSESTSVFTGQATDFWFDLGQAIAVTLNCDFELQRATATTTGGPGATTIAQALGQRMDKLKCPEGRNLVVNQQSGVVMVRAMPSELREIAHMIKSMQASIERQVMIEAKIIDVELNENFQSGINWQAMDKLGRPRFGVNAQTGNLGVAPASVDAATLTAGAATSGLLNSFAAGGAIGMAFQTASFASLINFLQTQGNVYVMSSPRIATLNNQKAVLKVGSDDFYITEVTPGSVTPGTTTTGNVTNPPSIKTQPFFSGVSLDVTPQIDETGIITLHVRPAITEVTEKDKTINMGGTTNTYVLPYASSKVKETDSIVRVRDGMIVAIGGLMSHSQNDTNNKVPGLGDVPVGGNLFKQVSQTRGKREMVILLKPTVIREEADWQQDIEDTQERLRDYDPRKFRKNATQTLP